jgi:hypothetical protein
VRDEECESDANGGDKGSSMFLGGQHEDCEYELGGKEHLDEQPLGYRRAAAQGYGDGQGSREQT